MAWLEARRVKFISKRVVWWAREAERALGGSMHCQRLSVPTRCGGGVRRCGARRAQLSGRGSRREERGGEAAGARGRGMAGRHAHPCLVARDVARGFVLREKATAGRRTVGIGPVGFGRTGLVGEQGPWHVRPLEVSHVRGAPSTQFCFFFLFFN